MYRDNHRDDHLRKFHQTLIGGAFTSAPDDNAVISYQQSRSSIVMNRERVQFSRWNNVEPVVPIPCWRCNSSDHQATDCDGREAVGIDDKKAKAKGGAGGKKNAAGAFKTTGGTSARPGSRNSPSPVNAPVPVVMDNKKYVKAQFDYDSGDPDDLVFSTGDVLEVIDDSDSDWLQCKSEDGRVGATPSNFVEVYVKPKPVAAPAMGRSSSPVSARFVAF